MSKASEIHFDKYDFIKSFIKDVPPAKKKEKEREAVIIADALKSFEEAHLTKHALRKELVLLEHKLVIKLTLIGTALFTILPILKDLL